MSFTPLDGSILIARQEPYSADGKFLMVNGAGLPSDDPRSGRFMTCAKAIHVASNIWRIGSPGSYEYPEEGWVYAMHYTGGTWWRAPNIEWTHIAPWNLRATCIGNTAGWDAMQQFNPSHTVASGAIPLRIVHSDLSALLEIKIHIGAIHAGYATTGTIWAYKYLGGMNWEQIAELELIADDAVGEYSDSLVLEPGLIGLGVWLHAVLPCTDEVEVGNYVEFNFAGMPLSDPDDPSAETPSILF